ncbi:MAG: PAS domain S-box protein [Methanomicrobiales archaeon]|nr:PAS domain S-box protein [Methanomicrobiales archaeon]
MDEVGLLNRGMEGDPHLAGKGFSQPRTLRPGARRGEIDSRIRKILWEHPRGLTVDEVGRALTISRSSAARHLDALAGNGEIDLHTYGQTRVFTLPRRASLASTLSQPSPLVLILSADLRVLEVNDPLLSVFQLQREDLIGRRIGESPFAAYAGERLLGDIRRGPGGKASSSEFETLVGDARYSFRARITPLSSSGGAGGIVLTLEDITGMALNRRRLEEITDDRTLSLLSSNNQILEEILERRQQEERMQVIQSSLDRAAMPAFWIGRDGRFLMVNPAGEMLLGYGQGELDRMAISDVDLDHPSGAWESFWETLRVRSAVSFESRFRTKKGDIIAVDVRASHVPHRDQEFGILFAEEITRRREAEEALRVSEATLRAFFEANPDPCFLIDREGSLLLANHAAAELLKADPERLIGTSLFDAMPEKAAGAREALDEVLEKRRRGIYAEEIGDRFFSTVLSPLLNESGEVDRVAIFARDFTDRKRGEDALRHANEKLNLLTAVTRHDVLNDIAALSMYLALPATGGNQGPGPEMTGKLAALVRSLERKMEFTRDYADLGMKMPGWEDITGSVKRAVAALDPGSLRVDLDLPALEIYADPLFERAVSNLVDNTLRHGGHASCIGFRARVEGDSCTLIVEDDGVGIPSGMKEPIFRPGYGRHTGFGLFLVREILGITGMSISETGEPERGARFEIRIPRGGFRIKDGSGGTHGDARIQV